MRDPRLKKAAYALIEAADAARAEDDHCGAYEEPLPQAPPYEPPDLDDPDFKSDDAGS